MGRVSMWIACAPIVSLALVCTVRAAVPEVESFNIELGQEFASDIAPLEGDDRAVVMFVGIEPRRLALIDATTRSVIEGLEGTFPTQVLAQSVAAVGRMLYLSQWFSLVRLDLDSMSMTTLYEPVLGPGPSSVAPITLSASGRRLFTMIQAHVLSIDPVTNEVVDLGQVGEEGYYGLALSPDEQHVYVSDFVTGLLTRFSVDGSEEPRTWSYVTASGIERSLPSLAVAPDGLVYAGYVGPEAGLPRCHLSVLDPSGHLLRNQIYPFYSTGMDLTRDGRFILLGNGDLIERKSLGIVARAASGLPGNEVRVAAGGYRAWVANYNSTFATVVDLTSLPLEVTIDVDFPGPAIRPNKGRPRQISAAILSTSDFDATIVDPASVCFGRIEDPDARACADARPAVHTADVNHDGRIDLTLRYETASTGLTAADAFACLTGRTSASRNIAGCGALDR
jgi:hypothetical protein